MVSNYNAVHQVGQRFQKISEPGGSVSGKGKCLPMMESSYMHTAVDMSAALDDLVVEFPFRVREAISFRI